MEQQNNEATSASGPSRRTIVKGAAWSLPLIATAIAAPSASASTTVSIGSGSTPSPAGTCTTLGTLVFTITTQPAGGAVSNVAVAVTLPAGFSWPDNSTGSKTFLSDSSGNVTVSGVQVASAPGSYSVIAQITPGGQTAIVPVTVTGVWIGDKVGYSGSGVYPIFFSKPADPANPGTPDDWAYCIENQVSARTDTAGQVGDASSYLGSNFFTDPAVRAKVLWVLAHSYPALSLSAFGTAVGVPGISQSDAIEATQYAIWRYTELTFDAAWAWETADSEAAYWYLVNGANAAGGAPGTPSVVSVPTADCGTPTPGDHAQSMILVAASV